WACASWHLHRWCAPTVACTGGRAQKHLLSLPEGDFPRVCPARSLSRTPPADRDGVAPPPCGAFLPARPVEGRRRISFEAPAGDVAFVVGHVKEEIAVRVGPLNLGDDTR